MRDASPPPPALPPGWAKLLALGVLLLAAGVPVVYEFARGPYPLGASLRALGGLLAVLSLCQLCRPPRTSLKARRAILVAALLLAVGVAFLLLGSAPGALRLADDAPGSPGGIGFAIPLVGAAFLGSAWGATRALRSLARRSAWSRGSRAFDRAALWIPLALLCSLATSTTLCVLGLALEAPLDPSSYPSFSLAAALVHGAAAALLVQALAASLLDQAQLRGAAPSLLARLAPRGRAGWLALGLVVTPTLALELGRALYVARTPAYERLSEEPASWTLPPRPRPATPYTGALGQAGAWEGFDRLLAPEGPSGRLPLPGDDPLEPSATLSSVAWSLTLTRAEARLLRLEARLSLVQAEGGPLALRAHTQRALGAPGHRLIVETRAQDPRGRLGPDARPEGSPWELGYVLWVALLSGSGEPRLSGCLGADPRQDLPEGGPFLLAPRGLSFPSYGGLWSPPPAPRPGLAYVVRLQGALPRAPRLESAPPPGELRIEAWDERHSYRVDSEQVLRARGPGGTYEARAEARRERRIPWRGRSW